MPISDRRIALLSLLFAITGCAEMEVGRRAPEAIALPDGIIVAGARGWCVDRRSTSVRRETSVVVLGSCASLGGDVAAPLDGIVTVTVGSEGGAPPGAVALESFFATEGGRAALALDGRAESVKVIESRREGDRLYLNSADESTTRPEALSKESWRALFGLEGRFVSVSFVSPSNRPAPREAGLRTVAAQVDALFAANRAQLP